ncbi:hypothetical protein [Aliidiomarina haloalkalitolerans]|uniref:Transporter n=1 Tax=Aliidiomarina haloalkalitolerans TaxID=859059 RepID=A0A432VRX5_9GAMM|nr:hypothetical protein [Aliidiomarina haloalkalitolerans]RUO19105.1 hypothetical protein CWE06_08680 [Aliidiomarina haloalkalitolerans]
MRKITLGLLSIFWLPSLALASTNMVVDDATIVDPQSCEIESWFGDNGRDSLFYFAPVCQFGESGVELTFAYERWRPYQQASQNYLTTQVKTMLGSFDQQRGAVAVALGSTFALDSNYSKRVPQYYVNVPLSYQLTPSTTVHANAGLLQDTVTNTTRTTSGVGIEQQFNASVSGFAELFQQRGDGVNWQIGTHLQQLIPGANVTLSVLSTEFDSGRDHAVFVAFSFRPRGW